MLSIDPKKVSTKEFYNYLVGAVAPRPIAFASTMDKDGNPNLAPFSFFNVFSANPPILVFSPARSGQDAKSKNTLENILEVPEVVINMVNYDMVHQMSLAGIEYPKGVNEFTKAGFTPIESEMVKPFRVKESPAQMECKVIDIIEVLMFHLRKDVLDVHHRIDPNKIDLVARLGANWYSRTSGNALFEVSKPTSKIGIGIDQIPEYIRNSNVLTGNSLGQLGNVEKMPTSDEIVEFKRSGRFNKAFEIYNVDIPAIEDHYHYVAKGLLNNGKVEEAWMILLSKNKEDKM
jgi:flavin reductase (DIM6/NTAB) family NADH-FMN oxidoreductase RutF